MRGDCAIFSFGRNPKDGNCFLNKKCDDGPVVTSTSYTSWFWVQSEALAVTDRRTSLLASVDTPGTRREQDTCLHCKIYTGLIDFTCIDVISFKKPVNSKSFTYERRTSSRGRGPRESSRGQPLHASQGSSCVPQQCGFVFSERSGDGTETLPGKGSKTTAKNAVKRRVRGSRHEFNFLVR